MGKKEFTGKDLVSTITGIVSLVITILVSVGVFTTDTGAAVTAQIGVIIPAATSIVSAVVGLIALFKLRG